MQRTSSRFITEGARALAVFGLVGVGCSLDRGDRWVYRASPESPLCEVGTLRCGESLERCALGDGGLAWQAVEDCTLQGLECSSKLGACVTCLPGKTRCNGSDVERCTEDGSRYAHEISCADNPGVACRGGGCVDLCAAARDERSNVGCEYWAADLDNADVSDSSNAAAQQFAVVVSNPQPDLSATVTIEQDDTEAGGPNTPSEQATAIVPPFSLRVFRLGPREVDGSLPGTFNTGTGTALTRTAYRVKSDVPVVVFQFNPLENVNVFSNDASLLKPVEALTTSGDLGPRYVVLGWPQTIATTDDPDTNFSAQSPLDLRAFLTIIGTRTGTHVRVHTKTRILGGGAIPATDSGGTVELSLEPFDVANLETDDFNADFTGSVIEADQPVVVFSGGEASDAPHFDKLSNRRCCADHLEEQLDPIRTAGKRFVATVSANRTKALTQSGARNLGLVEPPEYFRMAAATAAGAVIHTTLPSPSDVITLTGRGDFAEVTSTEDFYLESNEPISLASVSASQAAAGVPRGLPGGDPSLLVIPPLEQFRSNYVFLTPDRYSFDFVRVVAPAGTQVALDGTNLDLRTGCERKSLFTPVPDGGVPEEFGVYRCQLSFPVLDTSATAEQLLEPGLQNDGVHELVASGKVGVLVDGFDRNVSYAYAAGTELTEITTQ